ncbi:hypothetical protein, partial [Candidatus Phycosocius spiralis]|uniref:hypothetical protein n=1 Tax=Candidatus Phycosocius spiralis TaxID=2815099 RepID=UPI0024E0B86E
MQFRQASADRKLRSPSPFTYTNNGRWEGSYASSVAQRQNPPASGTPGPFANGAASGKQDEQVSSNLAMINSYSQGS